MRTKINEILGKQCLIQFAGQNKDIFAVYNNEDKNEPFFRVFDASRRSYIRLRDIERPDDDNNEEMRVAFAIDSTAKALIFADL